MKNLKNSVQLIGFVGKDPEIKEFNNGRSLASFPMATSDSYTNADGERITNTQWHNIVAWGNTAKFASEHIQKGKQIALEGKLINRHYTDKEGNKKYVTEVSVNEVLFMGPKPKIDTQEVDA